jgi:integrase/recombinase XerD
VETYFLGASGLCDRNVDRRNQKMKITSAKKPEELPIVLPKTEVEKILWLVKNHRYKLLSSLSYGAGLRLSEAVALKVKDMDSNETTMHIKSAKCQKDRTGVLLEKLIHDLASLTAGKSNNDYNLASERGSKLTAGTAQRIFENALRTYDVKKDATFHGLRHGFAAHLSGKRA